MIQKCSLLAVLEVFFKEPTKIHFIRGISKRIGLATTSVKNHIKTLMQESLVIRKKNTPFDGLVAHRDNEKFISYKKAYNLYSLFEIKKRIFEDIAPKEIRIFGSYSRGEDIEGSDIDVLVVSKVKKNLSYKDIEKRLERNIHFIIVPTLKNLDQSLQENILRGWIL